LIKICATAPKIVHAATTMAARSRAAAVSDGDAALVGMVLTCVES
jgi:hypothetical protein